MCSASIAHSSERRSAPANATSSRARSRNPAMLPSHTATSRCIPRSPAPEHAWVAHRAYGRCRAARRGSRGARCQADGRRAGWPARLPRPSDARSTGRSLHPSRTDSRQPAPGSRAWAQDRAPNTTCGNATSPRNRPAPSRAHRRRRDNDPTSGETASGQSLPRRLSRHAWFRLLSQLLCQFAYCVVRCSSADASAPSSGLHVAITAILATLFSLFRVIAVCLGSDGNPCSPVSVPAGQNEFLATGERHCARCGAALLRPEGAAAPHHGRAGNSAARVLPACTLCSCCVTSCLMKSASNW